VQEWIRIAIYNDGKLWAQHVKQVGKAITTKDRDDCWAKRHLCERMAESNAAANQDIYLAVYGVHDVPIHLNQYSRDTVRKLARGGVTINTTSGLSTCQLCQGEFIPTTLLRHIVSCRSHSPRRREISKLNRQRRQRASNPQTRSAQDIPIPMQTESVLLQPTKRRRLRYKQQGVHPVAIPSGTVLVLGNGRHRVRRKTCVTTSKLDPCEIARKSANTSVTRPTDMSQTEERALHPERYYPSGQRKRTCADNIRDENTVNL